MPKNADNEIWMPIRGYEEYYHVSVLGRIKSLARIYSNGRATIYKQQQIMNPGRDKKGYLHVVLTVGGIRTTFKVHRVVANHFLPNIENKPEVNHKNGIKDDNRVINLEWVDQSENQLHAYKMGLSVPRQGQKHGRAKLMDQDVAVMRELYDTGKYTHTEIANEFGIHREHCAQIIRRKSWTHI